MLPAGLDKKGGFKIALKKAMDAENKSMKANLAEAGLDKPGGFQVSEFLGH
jgi:hypothetical protein